MPTLKTDTNQQCKTIEFNNKKIDCLLYYLLKNYKNKNTFVNEHDISVIVLHKCYQAYKKPYGHLKFYDRKIKKL